MGVIRGTKRAAGAAGVQLNFIDPPHSGLAESKPPFRQHVAGRSNFNCQIRIFWPHIGTVWPVPFLGWRFSPPPYPHSQGDSPAFKSSTHTPRLGPLQKTKIAYFSSPVPDFDGVLCMQHEIMVHLRVPFFFLVSDAGKSNKFTIFSFCVHLNRPRQAQTTPKMHLTRRTKSRSSKFLPGLTLTYTLPITAHHQSRKRRFSKQKCPARTRGAPSSASVAEPNAAATAAPTLPVDHSARPKSHLHPPHRSPSSPRLLATPAAVAAPASARHRPHQPPRGEPPARSRVAACGARAPPTCPHGRPRPTSDPSSYPPPAPRSPGATAAVAVSCQQCHLQGGGLRVVVGVRLISFFWRHRRPLATAAHAH